MFQVGLKRSCVLAFLHFCKILSCFFPSSITVSLSKNNLNVCCFNCGSTLTTDKLKFSFCHKCPPEDAFPSLKIPCIVKPDLSSSLAFALSTVFQSPIDSNSWNPSPFWGVFDKGEVEVSQNTFRKVNNDLGKHFERSLWLGRYSSAHSLLNKQALALVNSDTHEALKKLHPFEEELTHFSSLLVGNNYWSSNPLTVKEVFYSLKSRKPGSAPGPSGLSYDHLKHAFAFSSVLIEKLCSYFNKVLAGGCDFPSLLKSSTLVALSKPGGGVRPIAVSESITRLFAVCVFNRCKTSCVNYWYQYQWGIGVVDGASSAVSAVQTLLYHHFSNAALMLDFSNAFNSITRSSILNALNASPLSDVVPYFFPCIEILQICYLTSTLFSPHLELSKVIRLDLYYFVLQLTKSL
ncbi:hypothetical protein RCL1_007912 [Eukaryota sp. TZLM3-RCL]